MSEPKEHPSTYFVQNRANEEELTRLCLQDKMLTTAMGGVLTEQSNPASLQAVLDIGSGPGNWLIELALTYPGIKRLEGVDVSARMVEYARKQASLAQLEDRLHFSMMDALRMLEFRTGSFDLVNLRLGMSFLRTWDWPKMIWEMSRVCRQGGTIRITEGKVFECNTPALSQLRDLLLRAGAHAGHFTTTRQQGFLGHIEPPLRQQGIGTLHKQPIHMLYQANTAQGELMIQDMRHVFRTGLPFLRKWIRLPTDYEAIYEQALAEMQQPGFVTTWDLLTFWGHPPSR
ncbi:class I SAM-dependent methyltransferase [Ktedonosporobacter rubrisoli]|uniref:Class I SAM-dependent methyltransferase n=1 Tax=Ktedonosporobacter rubrisoli TaxID=2509675 RepID=A0A4P6JJM6_KTERU|nr:class I SAM-dependent methyltransferase [Ktedonosporobacter rubrisoli]QBD75318.1 class I SAM-dependent methyltransferase [Ktedonosporobacter rubrisoli]